jgi:hypothetical protein
MDDRRILHDTPLARGAMVAAFVAAVVAGAVPGGIQRIAAQTTTPMTRRVNVPNLTNAAFTPAIFWLGSVGPVANYADVRVWHYDTSITVVLHIPDRALWYDPAPSASRLTAYDAVSLYISLTGSTGPVPAPTSYWFVKQLWNGDSSRSKAAFRGNGSGWSQDTAVAFTTDDGWRGNYPNDDVWDMGWQAEFKIPFSSLGLSGPPAPGTVWGLGLAVHDRDDAAGTPIPDQVWPETLQSARPDTWGQLRFGLPSHTPTTTIVSGTTTVRHGLNGAAVPDAAVGGHTICGDPMDAFTQWGNANYAGYVQFNIQNQWDISDFMCFSKYYVSFPLSAVPTGKSIVSARVRLHFFGNAGYKVGDATPSAINVLTVSEDWAEASIAWNNAPYAAQNVGVTWVYPVDGTHTAGPYDWDVSSAVADAYAKGQPLRLAFYSTDGDYHSGKYFYSSDSDDWGGTVRPTLEVQWGDVTPAPPTGVRVGVP